MNPVISDPHSRDLGILTSICFNEFSHTLGRKRSCVRGFRFSQERSVACGLIALAGAASAARPYSAVRPDVLVLKNQRQCRFRSTHYERVELVAVEIAKVRSVEAFTPQARGAFVLPTQRYGQPVNPIDLSIVLGFQSHHDSIAYTRRLTIEGQR